MSIFDKTVITRKMKRTKFNLSYQNLLTCNMGFLVPIFCKEVLPNDTFSISASAFIRFAPMLKPIFSNIKTSIHFWYVPNRLVWKNWNKFITGDKLDDGNDPVQPYCTYTPLGIGRSTLADYLGLPANTLKFNESTGQFEDQININTNTKLSMLPFRAYDLIWNNFYRDQELQEEVPISLEDGLDTTTSKILLNRAWKKDYFTSSRPQAQYGDNVVIPIGDTAPVVGNGKGLGLYGNVSNVGSVEGTLVRSGTNGNFNGLAVASISNSSTGEPMYLGADVGTVVDETGQFNYNYNNKSVVGLTRDADNSGVVADLSNSSAVDIFKLRTAFQMQKFLELTSRAGNRIKEYLKAHFGVSTSDARLQLPEFLGGSTNRAIFSEVLQTSESTTNSPQGNQSGHGLAYDSRIQVNKKFIEEHGFIIGLLNVQPDPAYCQGVPKQFTRETRFDYGLPAFQNIGEQAILQKELYGGSQTPDAVFGYAPRYSEYKSYNNEVHGDFRAGKDIWHTARIFENDPQLNSDFVKCQPTSRIFASDSEDYQKLNVKVDFNIVAKRPFQYFSNPGITSI